MADSTATQTITQTAARQAAQEYLNSRLESGKSVTKNRNHDFKIPVIDLSSTFDGSKLEDRQAVAAQIRDACTGSGFFHITGHGVSEETRQSILDLARRFFKTVPVSKKEALHVRHSKYMRGWEPADYTYVNPADWDAEDAAPENKQCFNWGYEAGLDPTGGDGQYRELDGQAVNGNVWPDEADVPGFYATIKDYYSEVLSLARHLFRLFALSLDLPESYFDQMMTHPGGIARLLYYPATDNPQPLSPDQKDKEIGLGAHTDYEILTILLSSSATGLEILSPDNVWIAAPVCEGSFIVNVADFLMMWTNGIYKSTIHRVVNRTKEERFSVPLFFSINYDQQVETLPTCITPENPSKYPPIKAGEYVLERLRATVKDG